MNDPSILFNSYEPTYLNPNQTIHTQAINNTLMDLMDGEDKIDLTKDIKITHEISKVKRNRKAIKKYP